MKTKGIQTKHVCLKNNQVYIKNNESFTPKNVNEEVWSPINFQWIPVVKLQEKFKI